MIRRAIPLLVLISACSQRSPWRVAPTAAPSNAPETVAAPAPKPAAPVTNRAPAESSRASSTLPSLSMVARVPAETVSNDAATNAHLANLLFPVAGMSSTKLDDSFDAPRDGGVRRHNAIDIMAPRGTPVLAVTDGRILRLTKNEKGGLSLYATDLEDQFVYYFAHFDRYHPKVYSGKPLMRGDTLGFVGTTGNAPKDLPHLHFQVMKMPADGRYMAGAPINPYPLLRQSSAAEK